MIITYEKSYRPELDGNGWKLYSDVTFKDSAIIYRLYSVAVNNEKLSFDDLYERLREEYRNKTFKSRCEITKDNDRIEVIVKGVFPRFYIQKEITNG